MSTKKAKSSVKAPVKASAKASAPKAAAKKVSAPKASAPTPAVVKTPTTKNVERNDLVLRIVDGKKVSLYVVRFQKQKKGGEKATLMQLEAGSSDDTRIKAEFGAGLLLGIPAAVLPKDDNTFRFDPEKTRGWIDAWSKEKKAPPKRGSALAKVASSPGDAGKYDVIFSRDEGKKLPAVYNVRFTETAKPKPTGDVNQITDPETLEAVVSVFRAGTYLAFLQQLGVPTGFTCTLLNTAQFWKK
jgi:hypothetical protein